MKQTIKLDEEIDMGQVSSSQDIADRRRERERIDSMPEVKELRRQVHRMRLEMDNYPDGSVEQEALIAKLKATNSRLLKYYDSLYESKTNKNTIRLNESQLRKIVAESVKKVLKEEKYSPEYAELKKNKWFDMTIDSIMGELWDAIEVAYGRISSVTAHRNYNYTSEKQEDAATAIHNIRTIMINNHFNRSKLNKDFSSTDYNEPNNLDGAGYEY